MKTRVYTWAISVLLLSSFYTQTAVAANDNISENIVETKQGKLRGSFDNGVSVWKGIKYAQANRFCAPQPVMNWEGVKDALAFGHIVPQVKSGLNGDGPQGEDCLNLNIWSPAADGKKRPVMFWIHGGGFIVGTGSADLYNGSNLSRNGDVVVVTINYRLGPLGFMYFKTTGAANNGFENNLGIRDQLAALNWVKENIAAFGGDPEQVTIFGESAGGTSVETLLSVKEAKGLFKGAIAESGPPSILWSPEISQGITNRYCSLLHVNPDSIAQLKNIPIDTLIAAEELLLKYMIDSTNQKVFSPTIDGQLLTNDIFSCMKPEVANRVPVMIGTNLNEATMFASKKWRIMPDNAVGLDKYFNETTTKESHAKVVAGYSNYPKRNGVLDILTDAVFRIPAIRLAECRSTYAPVYMYRFEWSSFLLNVAGKKSFHGLEIPFVFKSTGGKTGKLLKAIASKKLINRLSGEMQTAWVNFARYGNPNGNGEVTWKPYSAEDRATMIFSKKSKLMQDPDAKQRAAWDGVVYY